MEGEKLKKSLIQIAEKVKDDTTVEDIYKQLAYLMDIEESEKQESMGETFTQQELEKLSKKWTK